MISIASWSPRKSEPLTVSNACDSHESSGLRAALMPPAAALECERTGWTLDRMATVAPASAAARAARWPARPAPMIRTSCSGMRGAILLDRLPPAPSATHERPPHGRQVDRAGKPGGRPPERAESSAGRAARETARPDASHGHGAGLRDRDSDPQPVLARRKGIDPLGP